MKIAIMQPQYFPWPGFFELYLACDKFVFLDHVQLARGFTNRVQIKSNQGSKWLTIPIKKQKSYSPINKTLSNDELMWGQKHKNLIIESYREAPYYAQVMDIFENFLEHKNNNISDIAKLSARQILKFLGIYSDSKIIHSSDLGLNSSKSDLILEITRELEGTSYITGRGGTNYLDHEKFSDNGIEIFYMNYRMSEYRQLHGPFNPFVSILDMIANNGGKIDLIESPKVLHWRRCLIHERENEIERNTEI
jgi:hypothetical protein